MSAPVDTAITVEDRPGGALLVTIERRKRRAFILAMDEAAILHAELGRHLPKVTGTATTTRDSAQ